MFFISITELNKLAKELISKLNKSHIEENETVLITDMCKTISKTRLGMENSKNVFLRKKQEQLDELIYGKIDNISFLKEIY